MTEATAPVLPHQRLLHDPTSVALKPRLETTWAVLCGALASGATVSEVPAIARLLAGWLLADIILGFALAQLLATMRIVGEVGAPPPDRIERPALGLPYAEPGSPGDRLAQAVARWVEHWHARLHPVIGHHVASFVTAAAIALLVAAYLGGPALTAAAATLIAASALALSCGRHPDVLARWYAGMALAVAWYLGHRLFAAIPPASWGMAALVGLAAFGRVAQRVEQPAAPHGVVQRTATTRPGELLVGAVWVALVGMMLLARQPIAAGITAIAGLAESMGFGYAWARPARMGWLSTMLLAALIVARSA